ncbi:MAG: hypothetical protein ACKPKO_60475, partial [Candidatus Fonsibacter sp.]
HGRGQAKAMNLGAGYTKVLMAKGREVISKTFNNTTLTIHGRVLGIPTAERLLLDMGNLPRHDNQFNSAQRLQAIVSKCGGHKRQHHVGPITHPPHGLRAGS